MFMNPMNRSTLGSVEVRKCFLNHQHLEICYTPTPSEMNMAPENHLFEKDTVVCACFFLFRMFCPRYSPHVPQTKRSGCDQHISINLHLVISKQSKVTHFFVNTPARCSSCFFTPPKKIGYVLYFPNPGKIRISSQAATCRRKSLEHVVDQAQLIIRFKRRIVKIIKLIMSDKAVIIYCHEDLHECNFPTSPIKIEHGCPK